VKHSGRGELAIGELANPADAASPDSERCRRVTELFASAGVPCHLSADIEADLWSKLIVNCAGNGVAAIAQTTYGAAAREPHTREVMVRLIEETVAVGRASAVRCLKWILFRRAEIPGKHEQRNIVHSARHRPRQAHGN
jgi:2-dehydropantoate 2-reductase